MEKSVTYRNRTTNELPIGWEIFVRASMLCYDDEFMEWAGVSSPETARTYILDACEISSLHYLDYDEKACMNFNELMAEFHKCFNDDHN